jgi:AcrR family transcriptional regulator
VSVTKPGKGQKAVRTPGRPPAEGQPALQTQLLDAAEALFGAQGFAATSIRAVADQAGVNPSLVHYYFGNKRDLLMAVLDRAFEPIARDIRNLSQAPTGRKPGLEDIMALLSSTLSRHPNLPRLVVREVMLSTGDLHNLYLERYAGRLGGALVPVLEDMRRRGIVNPQFSGPALTLMLLSLSMFPVIAQPVAEPVLGIDYSPSGQAGLHAQIRLLLTSGALA